MEQFAHKTVRRESDEDSLRLIELSPIPALIVDGDAGVVSVNSAGSRFLGYSISDFAAFKLTQIVRSEGSRSIPDAVQQFLLGPERRADWEFLRKDSRWVWGEVNARSIGDNRWLLFINDLSARKASEMSALRSAENRLQDQKVEALERLAGGIAHDFNNQLAVILLQTEMMNLQLAPESPILGRVEEIKAVANDAAGIVRQLLAFGRKQPMTPAPTDLNNVISQFSQNLRALAGGGTRMDIKPASDLGVCFVDPSQVAQALMYLAVNAKDAMPTGGTLTIETSNVVLDAAHAHASQKTGRYVQIMITDTGVGMNTQTEDHIFEPFFSTKGSDKGAGLSMATVYGIVKQLGGFIWVESEVGKGTSFKIQFPRIDQPKVEAVPAKTGELAMSGTETVLLVDDDGAVRRIAAEILRISGYDVLEASSGMEALEIAQNYRKTIHLLISDYSMPQMNGVVTADGVKKLHPETAVLLMSGNTSDITNDNKGSRVDHNFLSKPFSSSSMTLKVREALGQAEDLDDILPDIF